MPGGMAACGDSGSGRVRIWARPPGNAGKAVDVVAERAGAPPPSSPVRLSGSIPPLAESFHQRPETGLDLRAGLYPGDTVVLTHGEETPIAPTAQGGTGKTQLAVAFTHALWAARAVEALVWVTASSRDAIVTGFAQAASAVGAADPGLGAEAAADGFITWLAHTRRPWALILDDLASLDDLAGLWPAGPAGQVVITTRLPETAFRTGRSGAHSMSTAPGPPEGYSAPESYGRSGSYGVSGGYGPAEGYGGSESYGTSGGRRGSGGYSGPEGYGTSGGYGLSGGYGGSEGYGRSEGYGPADRYGPAEGYGRPGGRGRSEGYGRPEAMARPGGWVPGGRRASRRRRASRGSPRSADSAAVRCWLTWVRGWPTSLSSGPRRSSSAPTWRGCRSRWARPPR